MQLYIEYKTIGEWPSLAWLAYCDPTEHKLRVFHGKDVETSDNWFCEAVWDGTFKDGNFDQTDIISGSGGRIRDGRITFVSSGSTVDRIQMINTNHGFWVSNSLVCLLSATDADVPAGYTGYWEDFGTIIDGIDQYNKHLHSSAGPVTLVYFNNLLWDGKSLTIIDKPHIKRDFSTWYKYYDFLQSMMESMMINMKDHARNRKLIPLGTLSSGYDSTTVTTLAVNSGCQEAISFANARGGDPDDGAETARALGIKLHLIEREVWKNLEFPEIPFIAVDAKGEDRYFSAVGNLLNGRVLFTGFHGDKIWGMHTKKLSENIERGDRSGLSLTEYRLRTGFIHCPVPFWGVRQIRDVVCISNSDEMHSWDIGGNYSRPVCRRIAESNGVPRKAFGINKRAASEQPFASPEFLTSGSMQDYIKWAKAHRYELVRDGGLPVVISKRIDSLIFSIIEVIEKSSVKVSSSLSKLPLLWRITNARKFISTMQILRNLKTHAKPVYLRKFLFPWAINIAKKSYSITPDIKVLMHQGKPHP